MVENRLIEEDVLIKALDEDENPVPDGHRRRRGVGETIALDLNPLWQKALVENRLVEVDAPIEALDEDENPVPDGHRRRRGVGETIALHLNPLWQKALVENRLVENRLVEEDVPVEALDENENPVSDAHRRSVVLAEPNDVSWITCR